MKFAVKITLGDIVNHMLDPMQLQLLCQPQLVCRIMMLGWLILARTNEVVFYIPTKLCAMFGVLQENWIPTKLCAMYGVLQENWNTAKVGTESVCICTACTQWPTECCELAHNALRRELTGVASILATCFNKDNSYSTPWIRPEHTL